VHVLDALARVLALDPEGGELLLGLVVDLRAQVLLAVAVVGAGGALRVRPEGDVARVAVAALVVVL